mgnify:CR=1 FL=1
MGCDLIFVDKPTRNGISIHAARVGCDAIKAELKRLQALHFNPRSPSGLRPTKDGTVIPLSTISIHAARVGCDMFAADTRIYAKISIHAARVGCDLKTDDITGGATEFQSTQPEWAATNNVHVDLVTLQFQSTQPEWAATAR